jgi:hypothetical protein
MGPVGPRLGWWSSILMRNQQDGFPAISKQTTSDLTRNRKKSRTIGFQSAGEKLVTDRPLREGRRDPARLFDRFSFFGPTAGLFGRFGLVDGSDNLGSIRPHRPGFFGHRRGAFTGLRGPARPLGLDAVPHFAREAADSILEGNTEPECRIQARGSWAVATIGPITKRLKSGLTEHSKGESFQ